MPNPITDITRSAPTLVWYFATTSSWTLLVIVLVYVEQRTWQCDADDQADRDAACPGQSPQGEVERGPAAAELAADRRQHEREHACEHEKHGQRPDEREDHEDRFAP